MAVDSAPGKGTTTLIEIPELEDLEAAAPAAGLFRG